MPLPPGLPYGGFGVGPFGLTPFGVPLDAFGPEGPTILRSSRKVDLVSGSYALDVDGNFLGMDDVGQRVLLAVRTAIVPDLQGTSFVEEMQAEVRRVLDPVIGGSNPDASLSNKNGTAPIVVVPRPGGVDLTIYYRNNLTGSETSVTVTK
jgi:hypothetical protein